jgi:acyl phosphate:glycerol-3-phosphate acyltransferase
MDFVIYISILIGSYLIGSISFGRLVTRILRPGTDLQDVKMSVKGADDNFTVTSIGGNTVSLKLGGRAGCVVALLDALKVFLPTLMMRLLYPDQPYFLVAATGGFIGHCWPIYYRFKGGRGISAFYGGLFAFDPLGALVVAFTSLLLAMTIFRKVKVLNVMMMYTGGVILIIPWLLITKDNPAFTIYAIVINVLFYLAMIPDIQQSMSLTKKYGWKNIEVGMDQYPMGQSMEKMFSRFSLKGKKSSQEK